MFLGRLFQLRVLVRVSVSAHGTRMFFLLMVDRKRRARHGALDARLCGQGGRARGCVCESGRRGHRRKQQRKSEFHFQSPG